jgi:hypothetical protein
MRPLAHSIATTAVATAAALVGAACDSTPRGRDASAGSHKIAEVAVRFEVAGDAAPSVSMLAYQAAISGAGTDDILSVVDPLTAPAPEGYCSLRDVAGPARSLGAAGGRVELEALAGWRLDLGDGRTLNASPRVFPDIASVVGGVVAELAPVGLRSASRGLGLVADGETFLGQAEAAVPAWPAGLALIDANGGRVGLTPPRPVPLTGPQGTLLPANSTISISSAGTATGDLVFGLGAGEANAPTAFLELRPFGATWALACPTIDRDRLRDRVVVPAVEVARLAGLRVPISVEAVTRESRALMLTSGGAPVRLTVEVRASSVVELRP